MLYTIGHEESYRRGLACGPLRKIGRRLPCDEFPDGYPGGYVFRTVEEAERRIAERYADAGYTVFGLLIDAWKWDLAYGVVARSEDGWWHHLLVDAEIVPLPEKETDADSSDRVS